MVICSARLPLFSILLQVTYALERIDDPDMIPDVLHSRYVHFSSRHAQSSPDNKEVPSFALEKKQRLRFNFNQLARLHVYLEITDRSRSGNLYPRHTSHVNVRALFSEKLFECLVERDGMSVCKRTSEWISAKVFPVPWSNFCPAVTRVPISATMTAISLTVNFDVILKVLVHSVTVKVITGPGIARKSNQHSIKTNLLRVLWSRRANWWIGFQNYLKSLNFLFTTLSLFFIRNYICFKIKVCI